MKIGIILETNEPEKAWNGVRFGNAALKQGHEVKIFLMSASVELENITHKKQRCCPRMWHMSKVETSKRNRYLPYINHD